MRAPISPIRHWRMQPDEIDENPEFVARCMGLWDQGQDTRAISVILFQPESIVATTVRRGRERRRQNED